MAKLTYKFYRNTKKKAGKTLFLVGLFSFIFFSSFILVFSPPELPICDEKDSTGCTCPVDKSKIKERSVILIDTTDPLRDGKYSDVDRIISEITFARKDFIAWIKDWKKVDQYSIYLLADKDPIDMRPIAIFCQMPPDIALFNMSRTDNQEFDLKLRSKISDSLKLIKNQSSANSSPIIETLAIITSNSANWSPGGNLIVVSDMIQNSQKCGWFNSLKSIPSFKSSLPECKNYVHTLIENLSPNSIHPDKSTVAFCSLPRSTNKPGLKSFWTEIFQEGLGYDIAWTCDPNEIIARHIELNNKRR